MIHDTRFGDSDVYLQYWDAAPTQAEHVYAQTPVEYTFYDAGKDTALDVIDWAERKVTKEAAISALNWYARKFPQHVLARGVGYWMPFVGWALFAYDVYTVASYFYDEYS
jgi:hypothetical protein